MALASRVTALARARRSAAHGLAGLAATAIIVARAPVAPSTATRLLTQTLSTTASGGASGGASGVVAFGDALALGAPTTMPATARPIAITTTATGAGYWVADSAGGVYAYGDATFHGSVTGALRQPIVAIARTPSSQGYWLTARDGGVFAFGDATYAGSTGAITLQQPIVGISATPGGQGYWLVARDGGVFAFGDASFFGAATGLSAPPIVAIAGTPGGHGYWLAARDGGVFAFGDAEMFGSAVGHSNSIVGFSTTHDGRGYWLASTDGGVFAFGDAAFLGSVTTPAGSAPTGTVTAIAATASGAGYDVLVGPPGTVPTSRALLAPPLPAGSGNGRRVVYSNSAQRLWLVENDGVVYDSYAISGRRNYPSPGTYAVWTRMRHGRAGSLDLPFFVGFAHGRTTSVGFHGIPLRPDGSPIESDAQLGIPLSHGCVRQNQADAVEMWDWAPMGTAVIVVP